METKQSFLVRYYTLVKFYYRLQAKDAELALYKAFPKANMTIYDVYAEYTANLELKSCEVSLAAAEYIDCKFFLTRDIKAYLNITNALGMIVDPGDRTPSERSRMNPKSVEHFTFVWHQREISLFSLCKSIDSKNDVVEISSFFEEPKN